MLQGLMMQMPLTISSLIVHADRHHGDAEIVSRRVEGDIHRTTYREINRRSRQLANALGGSGIRMGERVATIAWNGYRQRVLCVTKVILWAIAWEAIQKSFMPMGVPRDWSVWRKCP